MRTHNGQQMADAVAYNWINFICEYNGRGSSRVVAPDGVKPGVAAYRIGCVRKRQFYSTMSCFRILRSLAHSRAQNRFSSFSQRVLSPDVALRKRYVFKCVCVHFPHKYIFIGAPFHVIIFVSQRRRSYWLFNNANINQFTFCSMPQGFEYIYFYCLLSNRPSTDVYYYCFIFTTPRFVFVTRLIIYGSYGPAVQEP